MLAALRVVISGGIFLPPEAMYERGASHELEAAADASADKLPGVTMPSERPRQPLQARRATDALVDIESRFAVLTARQAEVYRAVARGLPNKLIARELGITESTVKKHVQEIFEKLGVETRGAATVRALEVLSSPSHRIQ